MSRHLEPLGDACQLRRSILLRVLRDGLFGLLPGWTTDTRSRSERACQLATDHSLEGSDGKREQLQNAVGIARLEGQLDGEWQHLGGRAPRTRGGDADARQALRDERVVERAWLAPAENDGARLIPLAQKGGQSSCKLPGSLGAQQEERPVALQRGSLWDAVASQQR